ncbi:MAG: prepilin-type N-terminal cleavage/methylation domain-containing protein [Patescibacteria group bacterium]
MRGFTLIEMVIYIALLGVLMTGALTSAANLIQSSGSSSGKASVQEEGSFVQRKLEWALADATSIPLASGVCGQALTVNKRGYANNPIKFRNNSDVSGKKWIEMSEGGTGPYVRLTSENVSASCLTFTAIAASGSGPAGVGAVATINSLDFSVTKYVRQ